MSTAAESSRKQRGYRATKDSKVAWLGEVPRHWHLLRLKYGADLVNEKVNGAANELPYTGLEHIESWTGKRLPTGAETTSDGQASVHRAGDVLFGKLRPYLAKACVAENDGTCTSELLVLRPKVVLHGFLRDYLLNPSLISVVDSSTYGAKMPRASWDFIGSLPVLVPPTDEQRSIVAFLDRETARIDALIEKKRRQIELLHEKRAALISHAVTKGLDPNAPMKDSGIDWLGQIPAHWTTKRIKHVAEIRGGQVDPRIAEYSAMPLIAPNHIESRTGRLIAEETADDQGAISGKYLFKSGDVLYSKIRPALAKACVAPFDGLCSADMYAMVPKPGHGARYLLYLLLSDVFTKLAVDESMRVAMPKINREDLGELRLPVAPGADQARIVEYLDTRASAIDRISTKIELSIDRLREYRTALISAAVTGKIDVPQEVA